MVMREEGADILHQVSKWESIHLDAKSVAAGIVQPSAPYQQDVTSPSRHFVNNILGISISPITKVYDVIHFAIMPYKHEGTAHNKLLDLIGANVSPEIGKQIRELFSIAVSEHLNRINVTSQSACNQAIATTNPQIVEDTNVDDTPTKKRKRNDLTLRKTVKFADTIREKIVIIQKIKVIHDNLVDEALTGAANSWYYYNARNIMYCLQHCHGGDVDNLCCNIGAKKLNLKKYSCCQYKALNTKVEFSQNSNDDNTN
jgi:hypothetical protein